MKKKSYTPPIETAYIGDSGTHYTQGDYDRYVFLMSCANMPILSQTDYFERLDMESYRPANEFKMTMPRPDVLKKLDARYNIKNRL